METLAITNKPTGNCSSLHGTSSTHHKDTITPDIGNSRMNALSFFISLMVSLARPLLILFAIVSILFITTCLYIAILPPVQNSSAPASSVPSVSAGNLSSTQSLTTLQKV